MCYPGLALVGALVWGISGCKATAGQFCRTDDDCRDGLECSAVDPSSPVGGECLEEAGHDNGDAGASEAPTLADMSSKRDLGGGDNGTDENGTDNDATGTGESSASGESTNENSTGANSTAGSSSGTESHTASDTGASDTGASDTGASDTGATRTARVDPPRR